MIAVRPRRRIRRVVHVPPIGRRDIHIKITLKRELKFVEWDDAGYLAQVRNKGRLLCTR